MGPHSSPKRGVQHASPNFWPICLLWSNGWMDQDPTWYRGLILEPRPRCMRWGPTSPQKGHSSPLFWAHVYCGQMAGWIKRCHLVRMYRPQPRHVVLDWDPALSPKRGIAAPIIGPCLLRQNGWMDQDATWWRGRPQPRRHCTKLIPLFSLRYITNFPNFVPSVHWSVPNFTPIGATCRPCGGKCQNRPLSNLYIPVLCAARNAACR